MQHGDDRYVEFVEHPRYGRGPRITGLNPRELPGTFFHWHSRLDCRIADTAIVASNGKQREPTVAVTHYFDVTRRCRDCDRMFIFFAEEQRHWYETLGFGLDSDCIRCVECRKSEQQIAYLRDRYDLLLNRPERTDQETLELIDAALSLIEQSIFGHRTIQRVRTLLNSISPGSEIRSHATFRRLTARADAIMAAQSKAAKPGREKGAG